MIAGNGTVGFVRTLLCVGLLFSPLVSWGQAHARGPLSADVMAAVISVAIVPPVVGPGPDGSPKAAASVASPESAPAPSEPAEPAEPAAGIPAAAGNAPPVGSPPIVQPIPPSGVEHQEPVVTGPAPPSPGPSPTPVPSILYSPVAYPPLETLAVEPRPRRPRFSMSMGMGISRDNSGLVGSRTVAIPAFQAQGGVGEGFLGFEVRLFSNQAAGRYHDKATTSTGGTALPADMAVDRLALDLMIALRPLTFRFRDAAGWSVRVLRSFALNLGFGAEHCSVGPPSAYRLGSVVGAHLDLPLTRASDPTDLRIRFSGRRLLAEKAQVGAVSVTDTSVEIFGGLALVF